MEYKGIDVSKWNGNIDWEKAKKDGIEFAIIRLGYCGYEGGITVDPMFQSNVTSAIAAGVDVGVYLFSYAKTSAAGKKAALETIDLISGFQFTYPIVFDIEDSSAVKYSSMSKDENTQIVKSFCSEIENSNYYAMIYASKSFLSDSLDMSNLPYDVWVAQWSSKCTYAGSYGIWQYSEAGSVSGISGNVDMNISYKNYPELIAEAGINGGSGENNASDETNSIDQYPQDIESKSYTVIKGDNLTKIAQKYGISLSLLIKANPQIKNADLIYPGDLLTIPE